MSARQSFLAWAAVVLVTVLSVVVGILAISVRESEAVEQDRGLFISGSQAARDVVSQCEQGPAACDVVLRRVNAELGPRGMRVFEDGSVVEIGG
jgi:hypothetical protein